MTENTFHKTHWLCVSEVTPAARALIRRGGGKCLDLPPNPDIPTFIMIMLPTDVPDWGICFWDETYHLDITMGNSEGSPTVTLYSKNISPTLIEESITDLVLSTPDEWEKYRSGRIAESQEKYPG